MNDDTNNVYNEEDEIKKLEERIRKLKQEQAKGQKVDGRKLEWAEGTRDTFFNEGYLLNENLVDSSTSNTVPTILGAVVVGIVLAFFSQVPIGNEDLARYSVAPQTTQASIVIDLGDLNPDKRNSN
jgi:hypothetical protein